MYAGDEFYGDDITSGPEPEPDRFRAFCEADDCLWSSSSTDSSSEAAEALEDHTGEKHPGQPIVGSIDDA